MPLPGEGPATDRRGRAVLFALWLLVFSVNAQVMVVAPILPEIARQLHTPLALLGTLVTASAISVALVAPIAGPVSDRVGRRRIMLWGTALLAAALGLHFFATRYEWLLGVRVLAGIAAGVLSGSSVAYIGDYFPYARRGWASGWVLTGISFGQLCAVPIGTLLAARSGYRAPFLVLALVAALSWLLIWVVVPVPPVRRVLPPLSVPGAFRECAALLRRPTVAAAGAVYTLMFASSALFFVYFPTWLRESHRATPGQIAAVVLVGGVGAVLAGPAGGVLSDRWGRKTLFVWASCVLPLTLVLAPLAVRELPAAFPVFLLATAVSALRIAPLQALLTAVVAAHERGTTMGLLVGLGQLGFGVGGAVAGPVFARFGYAGNAVVAALASAGLAWFAWRYLPEPSLQPPEESPHAEPGPAPPRALRG